MRLAMLIAVACLGLAAGASADGKEEKTVSAPPISPLEATGQEAAPLPVSAAPGHEPSTYRFGATYIVIDGGDALACETACDDEFSCQAWSFVDSYGASPARCELKRGQGRKEENRLATSGVATKLKTAALGETMTPAMTPAPSAPAGQLEGGPMPAPAPSLP